MRAQNTQIKEGSVDSDFVADYLRTNPDFLEHHPDVLDAMQISHRQEGTISLIERQIYGLREQSEQQQMRLDSLLEIAHQNNGLNLRVHRMILELVGCNDDASLFDTLIKGMRDEFQVELVVCRRLSEEELAELPFLNEFLAKGEPRCGRFSRLQLNAIFGDEAEEICSAVLVPLKDEGVSGVFALADKDVHRYHPGMAADYLAHLGDVVGRLLKRNAELEQNR